MGHLVIRPMTDDDVEAVHQTAAVALDVSGDTYGRAARLPRERVQADDPDRQRSGYRRLRSAVNSDPHGCWVAEDGDGVVGVGIALRREAYWVLSLLAVRVGAQSAGVGRVLLDHALRTRAGATRGVILATSDPKALHRYQRAGFTLHAAFAADGNPDRTVVPAGLGVRDADLGRDLDRLHELLRLLRGAAAGPEIVDLARRADRRLLVTDGVGGFGFVLMSGSAVTWLGAQHEEAAVRLLWAAIAESEGRFEWDSLTARQQWAIDVAVRARVPLWPGPSVCHWGDPSPFAPYLPNGVYG